MRPNAASEWQAGSIELGQATGGGLSTLGACYTPSNQRINQKAPHDFKG